MTAQKALIDVNGTKYRWPMRPVVVVCMLQGRG